MTPARRACIAYILFTCHASHGRLISALGPQVKVPSANQRELNGAWAKRFCLGIICRAGLLPVRNQAFEGPIKSMLAGLVPQAPPQYETLQYI